MQTHCRKLFTCHGYHRRAPLPSSSSSSSSSLSPLLSLLLPLSPPGRLSLCEIGPCEKLENALRVSLFFPPLLNARPRHNSFPNRRGMALSRHPTFLSYRQPFSPHRFAPLVNVRLYIQLDPLLPPPSTLTLLHYFFLF